MRIDCSKTSNKGDLLAILGVTTLMLLAVVVFSLAVFVDAFWGGFLAATIVWKWKAWCFDPLDRVLDRLWNDRLQE